VEPIADAHPSGAVAVAAASPTVEVVIPVYNEAHTLAATIAQLHSYLSAGFPFSWRITIADNASTDDTLTVADALAARYPGVRVAHLDRRGRGVALRTVWMASDAAVVAYMDVDLSTGLDALLPLVAPLVSGHSDVAIGSRLAPGANVARGPRRELISKAYNMILRAVFSTRVRDAQCGFKAIRTDIAQRLIPAVEDDAWFFDTELLLLAEHNGLRILEVPVDWHDDADTRVQVVTTALADLRGVARMARRFAAGDGDLDLGAGRRQPFADDMGRRLVTFSIIGVVSTAVSLVLFLLLRARLGPVPAVVVALVATAIGNSWAHRRWTLGHRGREGLGIHTLVSGAVAVAGIVLSVLALVAVDLAGGGIAAELAALAVAWTATTAARFWLLSRWATAPRTGS
jgi:putative flippase GtrA